jgi:hypothetical protein
MPSSRSGVEFVLMTSLLECLWWWGSAFSRRLFEPFWRRVQKGVLLQTRVWVETAN